jgi:hypothetical protein
MVKRPETVKPARVRCLRYRPQRRPRGAVSELCSKPHRPRFVPRQARPVPKAYLSSLMFGWLRKPDKSPAAELLQAFQSLGLYQSLTPRTFRELLDGDLAFEEILEEGKISHYERHLVLAGLQGIVSDWRFDADEALQAAADRLSECGVRLRWDAPQAGEASLHLGKHTQHWTYSTLQGLMQGVNDLLRSAGATWSFVGLESGGDQYFFVLLPDDQAATLRASPLFREWTETDSAAGQKNPA